MKLDLFNNTSEAQKTENQSSRPSSTRRNFLKTTGTLGVAGLTGCIGQTDTNNPTPEPDQPPANNTENTDNTEEPEQQFLNGIQLHDNWAYGETDAFRDITAKKFIETTDSINIDDLRTDLENSNNRIDGVASALETAADQYHAAKYEGRHQHILSALDLAIDELDDQLWDFDILSNMNYTQTVGETIQFSEIIVPKEENDHSNVEIINAALKNDYNNAIHVPGETDTKDQFYKYTMRGVRDSENDVDLPPHDVEAIQGRVDRGADPNEFFPSSASLMGYQLFAGGHEVEGGYSFRPDQDLVPANKEVHELINDVKYEQGDMRLNLAVNEKYFNEGYDEFDGPVSVNITKGESDWNISLEERPDWDWRQGYPEETA